MIAGSFIESSSLLNDTYFEDAKLIITESNDKGAMGFIVNRRFPRAINELVEFSYCKPFPIFEGGPVDQEHLFFIHQRPDLIKGGDLIEGNLYLGGDFKTALQYINDNSIGENDIKIFIGYCGWDYSELEAEIEEGSWIVSDKIELF
ncbi:YqgE/AlgH family protein [Chitinophaga silvatica]|uniref:YqgE/AlgH family protein n=1 Tax=Chitinophaga silvatica TaxID=2282649 RepID=A0A3E1YGX6_9BACT|nr:YqgE/AlgH family protein [Chitinophaga silvatica]RFS26614.1 YqgE/AlgH family protein [Chitinophaga silvatica]